MNGFALFCLGVVTAASVDVMWTLQGVLVELRAIRQEGNRL